MNDDRDVTAPYDITMNNIIESSSLNNEDLYDVFK
jgi:hypothetical protein